MKKSCIFIIVISILLLSLSWYSYFNAKKNLYAKYKEYISLAEKSIDDGLYLQAVENYYEAMKYANAESICPLICDAYDAYYEEETTEAVAELYITELDNLITLCPTDPDLRYKQAMIYMEYDKFNDAYDIVRFCVNSDVVNDDIEELYKTLKYKTTINLSSYSDYHTSLNSYIIVCNSQGEWLLLDGTGEVAEGAEEASFTYISRINEDGMGLYVKTIDSENIDTELLELTETKYISRLRYDFVISDSGVYDSSAKFINVKVDDKWFYINSDKEQLDGEFEVASIFVGDQAVVAKENNWYTIDTSGDLTPLKNVEDVKLDLNLSFIQNGVVLAKVNGKYRVCDTDFDPVSKFEADNIDLCLSADSYIAYEDNGLWGFVDVDGEVVIKPQYVEAKSFSNGFAAVCNEEGLWGYIDVNNEIAIDYQFIEAGYFNNDGVSIVLEADSPYYSFLGFLFSED